MSNIITIEQCKAHLHHLGAEEEELDTHADFSCFVPCKGKFVWYQGKDLTLTIYLFFDTMPTHRVYINNKAPFVVSSRELLKADSFEGLLLFHLL